LAEQFAVIGDCHGMLSELEKLLDLVISDRTGVTSGSNVFLVGDLLDRGPRPEGVVRLARQIGANVVMGNH